MKKIQNKLNVPINYNTEGIKYMGSKKRLLSNIYSIIKDLPITTVFDGFAGSTRVGQFFNNNGMVVISNDINIWSKTFGECYLINTKPKEYFTPLIEELNNTIPIHGWYSENYGGVDNSGSSIQSDGKKRIWQNHVTEKLDTIRETIDFWVASNHISNIDKSILLTSLILALDKVDSTLGHQSSYLREWSPRSYNKLILTIPNINSINNITHPNSIFCEDTLELNNTIGADLSYFDPPYGSSNDLMPSSRVRYGQYYHLWKTIILNDKPNLTGKINKREDNTAKDTFSVFEDYHKNEADIFYAQLAIESLIINSTSKFILLSYSTNSRVPITNILDFLAIHNYSFNVHYVDYKKNVMANMNSSKEWLALHNKTNYEVLIFIHNT